MNARHWDPDILCLLVATATAVDPDAEETALLEAGLGGIVVPPHEDAGPGRIAELSRTVHELSPDAVVTLAEEGGEVTTVQAAEGSSLPAAWALGEIDDVDLTRRVGDALGDLLAACEIDLVLAPVLDVATVPDALIGTRAFGDEPDLVSRHVRALAGGVRDAGIAVSGTHFPGTGALPATQPRPVIELGRDQLEAEHLGPWGLAPWLDAVTTAPVLFPALGDGPASLSPWATRLLGELSGSGFHGLLIAGQVEQAARLLGCEVGEAAVRAIEAGAHLVEAGDAGQVREAHDAVAAALETGRLDPARLHSHAEASRFRVRALRARRRWLPTPPLDRALGVLAAVGSDAARRAVRLRRAHLDLRPAAVIDVSRQPSGPSRTHGPPEQVMTGPDVTGMVAAALHEQGIAAERDAYEREALGAAQLLVLTHRPRWDREEAEHLHRVLSARPDAIVVHTGVPEAAVPAERLVQAPGRCPAMMRAAAARLRDAGPG